VTQRCEALQDSVGANPQEHGQAQDQRPPVFIKRAEANADRQEQPCTDRPRDDGGARTELARGDGASGGARIALVDVTIEQSIGEHGARARQDHRGDNQRELAGKASPVNSKRALRFGGHHRC
jgi:hypothetical protein